MDQKLKRYVVYTVEECTVRHEVYARDQDDAHDAWAAGEGTVIAKSDMETTQVIDILQED